LAPDHGALARLRDCIRSALAWNSIVEDVTQNRLVLDNLQTGQAKTELKNAEDVLPRAAREAYKWLLCPGQAKPTDPKPLVEAMPLNTGGSVIGAEIERTCLDNEWIIQTWSPIHLRTKLNELYWKPDKVACGAMTFWEDTLRYLYLPRLKNKEVLAQAIIKGAGSRDFYGTAYGQHEGQYDGFKLGDSNVQFDDTLLLIEPGAAVAYQAANQPKSTAPTPAATASTTELVTASREAAQPYRLDSLVAGSLTPPAAPAPAKSKSFHGNINIKPSMAKMKLVQVAEEIIALLADDPNAVVKVSLEIQATFPNGVSDQTKRAISENSKTLGFNLQEWE
jgi:hypothetical protein